MHMVVPTLPDHDIQVSSVNGQCHGPFIIKMLIKTQPPILTALWKVKFSSSHIFKKETQVYRLFVRLFSERQDSRNIHQAIQLATELTMRPTVGKVSLGLGEEEESASNTTFRKDLLNTFPKDFPISRGVNFLEWVNALLHHRALWI